MAKSTCYSYREPEFASHHSVRLLTTLLTPVLRNDLSDFPGTGVYVHTHATHTHTHTHTHTQELEELFKITLRKTKCTSESNYNTENNFPKGQTLLFIVKKFIF